MEDWREPLKKGKIWINRKGRAEGVKEARVEVEELNRDLDDVRE